MSKISITIDTETKAISATIDGKDVGGDISSVSAWAGESYYKRNERDLYWNVSVNNSTDSNDFSSYTHYCSATASIGKGGLEITLSGAEIMDRVKAGLKESVYDKVKADVSEYMLKKRGR